MLRSSQNFFSATTGRGYMYREAHFPYLKSKLRYRLKFGIQRNHPLSNKDPSEWNKPWISREGEEWYHRDRRRHSFVGWPYISWKDDPIRHHKNPDVAASKRTLSAKMEAHGNMGYPLWDHYAELGMDYQLSNSASPKTALNFMLIHIGSTWPHATVEGFLETVSAKFRTLEEISENPDAVRQWRSETPEGNKLPPGFVEHLILFARDVMRNNSKKAYRRLLHSRGHLKTNDMTRYYALPYVKVDTPAMPVKLEQPAGKEDPGEYLWLTQKAMKNIHPLISAKTKRESFYDA